MPDNDPQSWPEPDLKQEREEYDYKVSQHDTEEHRHERDEGPEDEHKWRPYGPRDRGPFEREHHERRWRHRRHHHWPRPVPPAAPPYPPYPPYAPFPPYPPYPPAPPMMSGGGCCGGGCGSPAARASSGGGGSASGPAPGTSSGGVTPPPGGGGGTPPGPSTTSSSSSASGTPGPTSQYSISSIPLAPMTGIHGGTGTFSVTKTMVKPSSVPGSSLLTFDTTHTHQVTTMLFQISDNVVPNWFAVAIPRSVAITDFGKPNIFFHPSPAQGGWSDGDYPSKNGDGSPGHRQWPEIFRYMELLGYQLDAAANLFAADPNQIVIMPFMTSAAIADCGIFPAAWFGICTDILTQVRSAMGGSGSLPVQITEVVVSSFSVGLMYSIVFRKMAAGLQPLMKQVWDFDGYPQGLSANVLTNKFFTALKYDQGADPDPTCIKLPFSRWMSFPNPPPNAADPNPFADPTDASYIDTHHLIPAYMFEHAATKR
jgi:hypothetical protein